LNSPRYATFEADSWNLGESLQIGFCQGSRGRGRGGDFIGLELKRRGGGRKSLRLGPSIRNGGQSRLLLMIARTSRTWGWGGKGGVLKGGVGQMPWERDRTKSRLNGQTRAA